jgi:hypothetical protein
VLLALGGAGLDGRELVVLFDEPAPLELERLDLLGDVPLALLERGLERREPAGALVELGLPDGHVMLGMELALVGLDLLAQRAPELLLARERGGELGAQRLEVGVVDVDRRSRRQSVRRGLGERGVAVPRRRLPTTLELGAQTGAEAFLGLCDVLRCEFRHAARLPLVASAPVKRRTIPLPRRP